MLLYCLRVVVLCCLIIETCKVVVCSSVSVVIHKVIGGLWIVLLVWMVLWIELWMVGK